MQCYLAQCITINQSVEEHSFICKDKTYIQLVRRNYQMAIYYIRHKLIFNFISFGNIKSTINKLIIGLYKLTMQRSYTKGSWANCSYLFINRKSIVYEKVESAIKLLHSFLSFVCSNKNSVVYFCHLHRPVNIIDYFVFPFKSYFTY